MRARTALFTLLTFAVLVAGPVADAAQPAPTRNARDALVYTDPLPGGRVISGFGPRNGRPHEGIDIKAPYGSAVLAGLDGVVTQAGPGLSGYGNTVTIDHGQGVQTFYAHLATVTVRKGQLVAQRQQVGTEGQTGSASTYHLHYEVWVEGTKRNPEPFLRGE